MHHYAIPLYHAVNVVKLDLDEFPKFLCIIMEELWYTVGNNEYGGITMLKRVITMICAVMFWTSVGMAAENWEYCGMHNDTPRYIDTSSVKVFTIGTNEIIKAKFKSIKSDTKYSIDYYKVDKDSKNYMLYQWENFENDKLVYQYISKNPSWNTYDIDNIIVNEILKRAN